MKVRHEVTGIHPERKTVSVKNLETGEEFEEGYDSPGLAVDEQGCLFLLRNGCNFFNLLQRQVPASRNMPSPILFGSAWDMKT